LPLLNRCVNGSSGIGSALNIVPNLHLEKHILYHLALPIFGLLLFTATDLAATMPSDLHLPSMNEPHVFRENKGQWPDQVLFKADFGSHQIWAERGRLIWVQQDPDDLAKRAACKFDPDCAFMEFEVRNHAFIVHFDGANADHEHQGHNPSKEYFNYLRGDDPSKWASEVREYNKIEYSNIYDGIDYFLYTKDGALKYDFVVHPGADPDQIKLVYEGLEKLEQKHSNLRMHTGIENIFEQNPYTYQIIDGEEHYVPSEFVAKDSVVTFNFPESYDPDKKLVIDPVLIFSSYSGSTGDNWGMTATPGLNGELFGAGIVFEEGYPTTPGAYMSSYSGPQGLNALVDMGITKFSADGTERIYSTYLGGNLTDIPHSIIVNSRNELVVLGTTSSANFPTTGNSFSSDFSGGQLVTGSIFNNNIEIRGTDIVVAVLNEFGTDLVGSTFMGGNENDGINDLDRNLLRNYGDQFRGEVVVDDFDNIYVASVTRSPDFPVTSGAFQSVHPGSLSGVVFSLNRICSQLRWSTFLGTSEPDAAYSLKLDQAGNVFVAGGTRGTSFPATSGSYKTTYQGGSTDGFVAKLNPNGTQLLSGTFIGTNSYDQVYFVELDSENRVYLFGQSTGRLDPTEGVYSNPNSGQFLKRLDNDLSELEFRTVFGTGRGSIDISPTALMVDDCNRIYTSGWGGSANRNNVPTSTTSGLVVTPDAFQNTTDGSDFYFFVLEEDATDLIFATFFGGTVPPTQGIGHEHVDGGTSRFSRDGTIYQAVCAGCGGNNLFPTTDGVVSPTNASDNCNLGVIKYDFELDEIIARASVGVGTEGCAPFPADFRNFSTGTIYFEWDFGDGNTSTERAPFHLYDEPGEYEVKLFALSTNNCLEPDTAVLTIEVFEQPETTADSIEICDGEPVVLESQIGNENADFLWNTGQTTSGIEVIESGLYTVEAELSNCTFRDSFTIVNSTPSVKITDSIACDQNFLGLDLDPRAENVVWSTGQNDLSIIVDEAGHYAVEYSIGNCEFIDSAFITFPVSPKIELLGDSLSCEGDEEILTVGELKGIPIEEYQWSTGETGTSIGVTESGNYSVVALSEEGCTDQDEIEVFFLPQLPPAPDFSDTIICADGSLAVDLREFEGMAELNWSDGSEEFFRRFTGSGNFTYTLSNVCEEIDGTVSLEKSPFELGELPMYFPNAFSPNQDGINDIFKPEFPPDIEIISFEMKVFDRWGNKVFETKDVEFGWDGVFDQEDMQPAVFAWYAEVDFFVCEAPQTVKRKGDVTILR
jgi:gliding motility-associated-like protein